VVTVELERAQPVLRIVVNGSEHTVPAGCTVAGLLERLEMVRKRVAVARNREVVPRSRFALEPLAAGDHVEILEAVGGG
jgi:thiamine biosynthesis protein ThiS